MDIALERQFNSLRTALKAASLAALIPAGFYFGVTLRFVSITKRMASDMLPEGVPLPNPTRWTFMISDLLSDNVLYLAPLALVGIGASAWFTVRCRSGHFLYLNMGLCLLLLTLGVTMRFACFQVYSTMVLEMNSL